MGKKSKKQTTEPEQSEDYVINPNSKGKRVDTTEWPLLLKVKEPNKPNFLRTMKNFASKAITTLLFQRDGARSKDLLGSI